VRVNGTCNDEETDQNGIACMLIRILCSDMHAATVIT